MPGANYSRLLLLASLSLFNLFFESIMNSFRMMDFSVKVSF
jgi:hypothetical protein